MSIASEITRINNNIANAYTQVNSKGGTLPATQNSNNLASAISSIPQSGGRVENPALVLWDWEGTKLAEYSAHDVQSMTTLPAPDTLPSYVTDNHEFLTFQEWNWSLVNIKIWIQNHEGKTLDVGAIYTTTDGQDHNYWRTPRLESTAKAIYMQKRATVGIGSYAFQNCRSLTQINIPNGLTRIGNSAFDGCYSLTKINIPNGVTSIGSYVFQNCTTLCDVLLESKPTLENTNTFSNIPSNYRIYVPRANLSWFETETYWSAIYAGGHIVAIEDYINYLESLGFDVDKYKEAMA